ncbi:hypothetical protein GCM10010885_03550 [Alicyclobacillus cellulosilyticus]|uniref:DUF881 domain-containing protein n=1 Tax=Alicyclobacillus cellulosilyticus TaxID=1003997 RepID=A0A917NF64_9BACL|nr:DUF881 domain-containing protein [Alicyclobacillus cellulosilyticus]GGI97267.1 hypothetical protein GCM10010885_03550 [Alicyclobacillus cellulosilyticus]
MQRRTFMWSLTGISSLLGFMLTLQLTSRPPSATTISSYIDLRTQVEEQLAEHRTLLQDIAKLNAQLAQFKASEGNQQAMRAALMRDAATVAAEAGLTPVTGPGIVIRIQDDPKLPFDPQFAGQFSKVADQEISQIVNDLFSNGAKAISINDQRLVTTSSIRLVTGLGGGTTLQVNGYPVAMPYVIKAVGDIEQMRAVLTVDNVVPLLNLMQEDCLITSHPGAHGVTVPGYNGPLPGTWAKEVAANP